MKHKKVFALDLVMAATTLLTYFFAEGSFKWILLVVEVLVFLGVFFFGMPRATRLRLTLWRLLFYSLWVVLGCFLSVLLIEKMIEFVIFLSGREQMIEWGDVS